MTIKLYKTLRGYLRNNPSSDPPCSILLGEGLEQRWAAKNEITYYGSWFRVWSLSYVHPDTKERRMIVVYRISYKYYGLDDQIAMPHNPLGFVCKHLFDSSLDEVLPFVERYYRGRK